MKKFFWIFLWGLSLLLIVVIIRTVTFSSKQVEVWENASQPVGHEAVERLAKAVRIPTISYDDDFPIDSSSFRAFVEYLRESYPSIHMAMTPIVFNDFSLLYRWQGSNPQLRPVVLMAHFDVVPPGDDDLWEKPPFSGETDGDYIWGRGTLDNKGALIQIMEAVEKLISEGFVPARTYFISFGHDEELTGEYGAEAIASYLTEEGIEAEFVLDEGMVITSGMVPMMSKPVALIGTSEKGYLSVRLSATMDGGYSATPARESAVTLIAAAVTKLNRNQLKPRITGPVDDFISYVGPEMPFYGKAIFANKWLFKPLLIKIYTGGSSSNAIVRTTTAPTILSAGMKDNAIPTTASAVINYRILTGETIDDIIAHIKRVVSDERVSIEILPGFSNPAPVSPTDVYGFKGILKTIRQVYPEVIVSPTMMIGSTDGRHFTGVSRNVYRFAPYILNDEDLARIHGPNERIRIEDYLRGITFYYYLIRNSNDEEME